MKQFTLGLALLTFGCGVLTSEPESVAVNITIDHGAIRLDPETGVATVPFVIRNTGEETIYVERCGERVLTAVDRRENGAWIQRWSDICPAVYDMSPLRLTVQGQHRSLRTIHEPGEYRLRIGVSSEAGQTSAWATASRSFTIDAGGPH